MHAQTRVAELQRRAPVERGISETSEVSSADTPSRFALRADAAEVAWRHAHWHCGRFAAACARPCERAPARGACARPCAYLRARRSDHVLRAARSRRAAFVFARAQRAPYMYCCTLALPGTWVLASCCARVRVAACTPVAFISSCAPWMMSVCYSHGDDLPYLENRDCVGMIHPRSAGEERRGPTRNASARRGLRTCLHFAFALLRQPDQTDNRCRARVA